MATVALMVGGALVNALAFSGSNYLFSMLGHSGGSSGLAEERKRHDLAIEQLQTAQAAWSWRRIECLDFINEHQHQTLQSFHDSSAAMHAYTRLTGKTLAPLGPQPQLFDFYTPSSDQTDREIAFVVLGMAATGLVTYMVAKR